MIIVTGGAGFIGSAIVAELNRRGISDILIVDELASDEVFNFSKKLQEPGKEKWRNLHNLSFTDCVHKSDFQEMVLEGTVPSAVDAVFHMGACSDTTETNTSYLQENNFEYTKLLAQWAVNSNIRFNHRRLCNNSSAFYDQIHETYLLRINTSYEKSRMNVK